MCIEFFGKLVALLRLIPDVVWSGIVASVLTLSGVIISNNSNTKRLNVQLKHDAVEKMKERIAGIRREVYLRGTDEAHKVMRHLINLPNIEVAEVNSSEELHGFQSSLSKAKLVAEPDTVAVITLVDEECTRVFSKLLVEVQGVQDARAYIAACDENIAFQKNRAEKIAAEINIQGNNSDVVMENLAALVEGYETCMAKVAERVQRKEVMQQELNCLVEDYNMTIFGKLTPFGTLLIELEIAMRGELGLVVDAVAYRSKMELQRTRAGNFLKEVFGNLGSPSKKSTSDEKMS